MSRKNRSPLADRVAKAAEASLAAHDYVSPIGVFLGIGWLDPNTARRWRQRQLDCVEEAMQTNPQRLSEAMEETIIWFRALASEFCQKL
jgi:hypothetical protein